VRVADYVSLKLIERAREVKGKGPACVDES
jgi:hypothetical protein